MKKLLLVLMLFAFGCTGFQYKAYKLEDKIVPNIKVHKVLKSENEIHAVRYGVRFTIENGQTTKIGLYKIVIGDLDELDKIHGRNKVLGFAGTLLFPNDLSSTWQIIEVRHHQYRGEPYENRKLSERTVQKKDLPNPLNIMPDDLFKLVENAVMYKSCMIIYILPETSLDDIGRLFGFVVKYGGG
jgi:hypothetical protein